MIKLNRFFRFVVTLMAASALLSSCANRIPPSGGPKDTSPPIIIRMVPKNLTTSFSENAIKLTFDEYFLLEDPFSQIVISPPLKNQPKYKIRGKNLVIELNNELSKNTTYSVNFGESIKDFRERNTLRNFTYVFSTGRYLDSLQVTGKLYAAANNSTEEGYLALLYKENNDTSFTRGRPFYFTKCDQNGNFAIQNIGEGNYRLYALKDNNLNYRYDSKEELIGFVDTMILVKDSIKNHHAIPLFKEESTSVRLLESKSPATGKFIFVFSGPVRSIGLDTDQFIAGDFASLSESKDTLTYWTSNYSIAENVFYLTINDTLKDTATVQMDSIAVDSLQNTAYNLRVFRKSPSKSGKGRKEPPATAKKDLYRPVIIPFNRPILQTNLEKIRLLEDTTKNEATANMTLSGSQKNLLSIDYQWKSGTPYLVEIPDSTLVDLFGLQNDFIDYAFETEKAEQYAAINLNVFPVDNQEIHVFELYNAKNRMVASKALTLAEAQTVSFKNILSGTYNLRIYVDANGNNRWDTGNLERRRQPEKVVKFAEKLSLRPNWEMDLDIKLKN